MIDLRNQVKRAVLNWALGLVGVLWVLLLPAQSSCDWPPSPLAPANADSVYGLVRVPVVVHVVWRQPHENISDQQVISQIDALNRDYRRQNPDREQVTQPLFRQLIADMEIEFYLANLDPQGQPTSGILRRQTTVTEVAQAQATDGRRRICYDDLGGSNAWPSRCYLNIWVGAFPPGIAGQGAFPGQAPAAEDGVFIDPQRFGTLGSVTAPYHLGRTATHEIGHYFNLQHLWGAAAVPTCNADDGIADTPCQSLAYLNQCPTGLGFTCGTPDLTQNFMGFSHDACLLMFTHGQKQRLRAALHSLRNGFLEGSGCLVAVPKPPTPPPPSLLEAVWQTPDRQLWVTLRTTRAWRLQLWDLQGRPIAQAQGHGHQAHPISLPTLPAGIYLLVATDGERHHTQKIIFTP